MKEQDLTKWENYTRKKGWFLEILGRSIITLMTIGSWSQVFSNSTIGNGTKIIVYFAFNTLIVWAISPLWTTIETEEYYEKPKEKQEKWVHTEYGKQEKIH